MSVGGGPGASGFGCEWVFVEVSWGYVSWGGGLWYGLGAVGVTGVCAWSLMHAEVGAVAWVWVCGVRGCVGDGTRVYGKVRLRGGRCLCFLTSSSWARPGLRS